MRHLRSLLPSSLYGHGVKRCFSTALAPYAIAFDIDGVLLRGKTPIPGAVEALALLRTHSIPYVFLTNGCARERVKAESLGKTLGCNIDRERVIVSHSPMRSLAGKYENDLVLLAGRRHLREIATDYGFRQVLTVAELHAQHPAIYPDIPSEWKGTPHRTLGEGERIAAVMVIVDPHNWERDLQILCDVLRSDGSLYHINDHLDKQCVALYCSCPDLLYSAEAPTPRFGAGAFTIALRALFKELTGKSLEVTWYGKPYPETYRYAERVLGQLSGGQTFQRIYGIGDNPLSDIAGANAAGAHWRSVLVRTGLFRGPGNDSEHPAHIVTDDVLGAVMTIIERERTRIQL